MKTLRRFGMCDVKTFVEVFRRLDRRKVSVYTTIAEVDADGKPESISWIYFDLEGDDGKPVPKHVVRKIVDSFTRLGGAPMIYVTRAGRYAVLCPMESAVPAGREMYRNLWMYVLRNADLTENEMKYVDGKVCDFNRLVRVPFTYHELTGERIQVLDPMFNPGDPRSFVVDLPESVVVNVARSTVAKATSGDLIIGEPIYFDSYWFGESVTVRIEDYGNVTFPLYLLGRNYLKYIILHGTVVDGREFLAWYGIPFMVKNGFVSWDDVKRFFERGCGVRVGKGVDYYLRKAQYHLRYGYTPPSFINLVRGNVRSEVSAQMRVLVMHLLYEMNMIKVQLHRRLEEDFRRLFSSEQ